MSGSATLSESVKVERDGAIALVRLATPPLNLLTQDMRLKVRTSVEELQLDDGVRAIVLTGGANFCAGADLKEFDARKDPAVAMGHCRNGHAMTLALVTCAKPLIAAIEGACLGGGLEIALCCDARIAATDSRLGLPEVNRGIFPGTGGIALLERLIGPSRAKDLIFSGEILHGSSISADGIVDRRVMPGGALEAARALAHRWAAQPAASVQAIKRLIDRSFVSKLAEYLEIESGEYTAIYQRPDANEGWMSFLEKRAPVWTHG